jgi:hypothetical protein
MKFQMKVIEYWLILMMIEIVFFAGITTAVGCVMVFFGQTFLWLFTLSRWVAVAIWTVMGLLTLWFGVFDPGSGTRERPSGIRGVVMWFILWPLVWFVQGLILIA